ncbi:MAG: hypothetical protein WDM71_09560 [Ferruginibacter sp.]
MQHKNEIQAHPDKHIDQDFPDYPDPSTSEGIINPKPEQNQATAAINIKDEEKKNKKTEVDEGDSDGSANAFLNTEELIDDED